MAKIVRIYTLSDPFTGKVRYVGRTVNPLGRRLKEHVRCATKGKLKDKKKELWIKSLLAKGLMPVIELIQESDLDNFQADEKRWVKYYREQCHDLLNVKEGGDGSLGGHFVQWDDEKKELLGVVSDSRLAKMMGISRKAVLYWREQFGIPASYDKSNMKPPPIMGGHNKLNLSDEIVNRMGKEPDYVIATSIGVDKSVIARRRKSLNIPSYAESTGNRGCFTSGMPHPRWSRKNEIISTSSTI